VNARNATTDARCEASVNKVMVTIRHNVVIQKKGPCT